jgi:hypothetical protein
VELFFWVLLPIPAKVLMLLVPVPLYSFLPLMRIFLPPALYTITVIGNTDLINITFLNVPISNWVIPANVTAQMLILVGM